MHEKAAVQNSVRLLMCWTIGYYVILRSIHLHLHKNHDRNTIAREEL